MKVRGKTIKWMVTVNFITKGGSWLMRDIGYKTNLMDWVRFITIILFP